MAKLYVLNETEIGILRAIAQRFPEIAQNVARRPSAPTLDLGEDHQAPETYIVKPQASIAALSGSTISSGECDVYQIIDNEGSGQSLLEAVGDFPQLVYNQTSSALETSQYYVATRDKYGNYVVCSGGESLRWFCLVEDLSMGGTALARDTDNDETFSVYDACNEFYGTANESCGVARSSDGRIIRLTCPDFNGCGE